jgi:soluble lytic murein transglycosylase-like protein
MKFEPLGSMEAVESRIRQLDSLMRQYETSGPALPATIVQGSDLPPQFKTFLQGEILKQSPSGDLPKTMPSAANTAQPAQPITQLVESVSQQFGVDKHLVTALIQQESGFNPKAVSKVGAQGLMQLMPQTAKSLGVNDPFNPAENLTGGVKYLKRLMNRYRGNIPLALAAYNAGEGAVSQHGGIPPYKETQHYVRTILANYLKHKPTV